MQFNPTAETLAEATKYLDKPESINMDDLPLNFSWEDIMGTDFTGPKRDQSSCGSCFVFAIIGMIESRIKIRYAKALNLSVQFVLECSFTNEGCHGGCGLLAGYWLETFWTTSE